MLSPFRSAIRTNGRQQAVADAFATAREERLAGVGAVDAGRLAGENGGGDRAQRVGPGGEAAHREGGGAAVVLAHVEVAVAVEFDDPRQAGGEVGRELVVVDRLGGGDEERVPAGVGESLGEVALVVVDEEVRGPGSRPRRPPRGGPCSALDCAQSTRRVSAPLLCTVNRRCRKSGAGQGGADAGEAPGAGDGIARRESSSWAPAAAASGSASSAAISAAAAPGFSSESSFSSRQ